MSTHQELTEWMIKKLGKRKITLIANYQTDVFSTTINRLYLAEFSSSIGKIPIVIHAAFHIDSPQVDVEVWAYQDNGTLATISQMAYTL